MSFITGHPLFVTFILFLLFSIPIVVYDMRTMRIPDIITYTGIVTMLCYRFACTRDELLIYIAAAVISVLLFIMVRVSSKRGLGWGDVKYSALCGLYAGPIAVFGGYILASVFAGIWYLIRKRQGKMASTSAFPFAPFMAAGTTIICLIPVVKAVMSGSVIA